MGIIEERDDMIYGRKPRDENRIKEINEQIKQEVEKEIDERLDRVYKDVY